MCSENFVDGTTADLMLQISFRLIFISGPIKDKGYMKNKPTQRLVLIFLLGYGQQFIPFRIWSTV